MKIIFMGTPDFSVSALEALYAQGFEIVAAYSQPPRPAGRGQKEKKSPVHIKAEELNITVKTPKSLKSPEAQEEFKALNADFAVVVAYGLILPKEILEICPCINIHASLLPRWRGAAPIQRAIEAGDAETGITTMLMDEGLDTGDMLLKESIEIGDMNAGTLHDKLSEIGANIIVKTLNEYEKITPQKQQGNATYASKISKDEAKIDWNNSATNIYRKIKAFNPFPGAYFEYKNEKFKILDAELIASDDNNNYGITIDESLSIQCQNGLIKPTLIQRQGKKPMPIEDLLRGFKIPKGIKLD